MAHGGLTEKNMMNKKFKSAEDAIFIAYCCLRDCPSAKIIARRARVARSTFYKHHKTPQSIPGDYEKYLLEAFSRRIRLFLKKKDISLRLLFFRLLIFVHNNRKIFQMLFMSQHKEIIKKMIDRLEVQISVAWRYAYRPNKLYDIYKNEFLGIIEIWSKTNFSIKELDKILSDILYLTKTAPKRLERFKDDD